MLDGVEFGKEVVELVRGYVEREVAPLKAENESLKARVAALEALPAPERGEPGEKGADGVTPAPEAIAEAFAPLAEQIIADAVGKAVAELPTAEPGPAGGKGDPGERGQDGADGKDGRGVKELLIDRDGNLVATMDDGEMKSLGLVCGRDGANGADGAPGNNGRDGFSIDDFDCRVLDDDRTIELSFKSGENEHIATLKWPTVIDRGVWKEGPYDQGDGVTWGGSYWIAQCPNPPGKPDTKDSGWRLACKRGRDGKDAKGG